jgi:Bacterial extracellular solute-binding proteins, family 3
VLLYGFIATAPDARDMKVIGEYLSYDPYGLVYRRDDPAFAAVVERTFNRMASERRLAELYSKWFLRRLPMGEMLNLPISPQLEEIFRRAGSPNSNRLALFAPTRSALDGGEFGPYWMTSSAPPIKRRGRRRRPMAARRSIANITTALRSRAHPFLVFPNTQLLVDAFARHPDHVGEIHLGDGDLALLPASGIGIDKAHECLGETARQVEEHDLLRLLGGPAQLRAQYLDDPERDFRILAHQRQKIPALNDEQFAVRHRGGVGGAGVAVQERDLTEDLALAEHVEHGVLTFHRGNADPHRSRSDGAQAGPGIALGEYVGAALHRLSDDAGAEAIDVLRRELPEQIMISKDDALIGASVLRAIFAGRRHVLHR